jgi:hypothetical protein
MADTALGGWKSPVEVAGNHRQPSDAGSVGIHEEVPRIARRRRHILAVIAGENDFSGAWRLACESNNAAEPYRQGSVERPWAEWSRRDPVSILAR